MLEREHPRLVEHAGGALAQQPQPDLHVAEQPALLAQLDRGAVGELARLADVVDDRGADQQVAVEPRVSERQLLGERRDGDRMLEQPAQVGVVAGPGAGGGGELDAEAAIGEQLVEQPPVARIGDLAGQVLEEPVELVEVAVGDRQELGRIDRPVGLAGDPRRARSGSARGSARRAPKRAPARRRRSARPAGRRRGTAGRAALRCGRAARARGTERRSARSGAPCACRRRCRRPRRRAAAPRACRHAVRR